MRQGGGSGSSTVDDGEGNEPDGTTRVQTQSWRPLHRHLVGERRGPQVAPDPVHGAVPSRGRRGARTSVSAAAAPVAAYVGDLEKNFACTPPGEPVSAVAGTASLPPKADGRQRPLGIPALEDKIVQGVVAEVFNAICEADFLNCSHGFRPARSPHDALRTVHAAIMGERMNWVVDADIRDFSANSTACGWNGWSSTGSPIRAFFG